MSTTQQADWRIKTLATVAEGCLASDGPAWHELERRRSWKIDWTTRTLDEVLAASQAGDDRAWHEFHCRVRPVLWNFARLWLVGHGFNDRHQVEDLLQQVWLTRYAGPLEVLQRYNPGRHRSPIQYLINRLQVMI